LKKYKTKSHTKNIKFLKEFSRTPCGTSLTKNAFSQCFDTQNEINQNISTFCIENQQKLYDETKLKRRDVLKKLGKSTNMKDVQKGHIKNISMKEIFRKKSLAEILKSNENIERPSSLHKCKINKSLPNEGTLSIQITDNGCGMTDEEIQKLFKPYSQVNSKVYSQHGGTGLGLWISQQLIKAMHGTIKCQSIPGQGTTFTIEIPVKCCNQLKENVFFMLSKTIIKRLCKIHCLV